MRYVVLVLVAVVLAASPASAGAGTWTAVPPATVRAALLTHGWSTEAAAWVMANVRIEYDAGEPFGGYAPGRNDLGRITINPSLSADEEAITIEHEAHHAWDYGHHPKPWGLDEQGVRADMQALATEPDDAFWRARHEASLIHDDDVAHYNHRLAEALDWDFTLVPRPYAEAHFGYAARMTAAPWMRYRTVLPLMVAH